MSDKPVLAISFKDCVSQHYDKDGSLVPGFLNWAVEAYKYFKLVIYSEDVEIETMESFTRNFTIPWRHEQMNRGTPNAKSELQFEFSKTLPPTFISIGPKFITFTGRWDMPYPNPTELLNFKPWTEPQILYQLPESLGQPDAQQQGSRVAPPLDAVRKCPKHPWMTRQNQDGSRDCMVSTCNWTTPAPP